MQLTGGQAVVETLKAGGVDTVFGIPGVHNLAIYDALYDSPEVTHVLCRHEQGAGFAADGYARVSGKPGVFVTTTGPGATNAFTAVAEAWSESSPVLHLASLLDKFLLNTERGVIHELVDQAGTFRNVTRRHETVTRPEAISGVVAETLTAIQSGRPRPAYLDFPQDTLNATAETGICTPQPPVKDEADPALIEQAAARLGAAKRPAILAGTGIHRAGAWDELRQVAEALQAPVFETAPGKGAIPGDHPLSIGNVWTGERRLQASLADADVLLVVGCRLGGGSTNRWTLTLPPIIHIDADPATIGLNYPAEIGIVGDARLALTQLLDALQKHGAGAGTEWPEKVAGLRDQALADIRASHPESMGVVDTVREVLDRDAIVTNDSLIQYWMARHFPVYTPRSFMIPWIYGTLGSALPYAIGAAVAAPERQVVAIGGDGAFVFTGSELATAIQANANVVCVVCNDGGYQAMRRHQRLRYGERNYATELVTPDFAALARSYGALGLSLESPADLGPALREALAAKRPAVIDLPLSLDLPWQG